MLYPGESRWLPVNGALLHTVALQTFTDEIVEMLQCSELVRTPLCCAVLCCAVPCNLHAAVSALTVGAHLLSLCLPDVSLPAARPTRHTRTPLPMCEQEQLARGQRGVAEQVFAGTYPHQPYKPLSELVPEGKVDLNTFLYMSSLVRMHGKAQPAPGVGARVCLVGSMVGLNCTPSYGERQR